MCTLLFGQRWLFDQLLHCLTKLVEIKVFGHKTRFTLDNNLVIPARVSDCTS